MPKELASCCAFVALWNLSSASTRFHEEVAATFLQIAPSPLAMQTRGWARLHQTQLQNNSVKLFLKCRKRSSTVHWLKHFTDLLRRQITRRRQLQPNFIGGFNRCLNATAPRVCCARFGKRRTIRQTKRRAQSTKSVALSLAYFVENSYLSGPIRTYENQFAFTVQACDAISCFAHNRANVVSRLERLYPATQEFTPEALTSATTRPHLQATGRKAHSS